jgi:hypothetical protein
MRLRLTAAFALVFLSAAPAFGQKAEDVVRWTASGPAAPVKPGGTATIEVKAEIDASWHMYALTQLEGGPPPLDIALAKRQPFTLDRERITGPMPEVTKGPGSEPDVFYYDETVTFSVPVVAPKTLKPGTHTVSIEATYTVCSGNICLRPATAVLSVALASPR